MSTMSPTHTPRLSSRLVPVAALVAVVGLAAVAGADAGKRQDKPTLAIMPLAAKRIDPTVGQALTEILTLAITRSGRYNVMTADDVNAMLKQEKLKDAFGCDDVACAAEIAGALGTDLMITGSASKLGDKITISLTLFDSKKLRVIKRAGASVANDENLFERAMLGSLGDLVGLHDVETSTAGSAMDTTLGDVPTIWNPEVGVEQAVVEFASDPPGAVVMIDGRMICQDTVKACGRVIAVGGHTVSMQKERYLDRRETVVLKKGTKITWKLTPNFGWLSVRSTPPNRVTTLNGRVIGESPIDRLEVDPGMYEVMIQDPCYLSTGRKVQVARDEAKVVEVTLAAREAAINVTAEDKDGNAVEAEVLVDRSRVGTTPGVFKVPVCAEELEVNGPKGEFWKAALGRGNLKEGMVADVKALLKEREATHVAAVPQAGSRTAGAAVREPRMGEIAGWVTAVAGAGLLIGYVVEALQARSTKSQLNDEVLPIDRATRSARIAKGERQARTANILFGLGLGAEAVGGFLIGYCGHF